jgi:hypothetical protein
MVTGAATEVPQNSGQPLRLPGVPHPVAPQATHEQVVRLHLHRRPAHPVAEGQDPRPDPQDITMATQGHADPAQPDHAGWANYFKHAVCKHTLTALDDFVWHRTTGSSTPS